MKNAGVHTWKDAKNEGAPVMDAPFLYNTGQYSGALFHAETLPLFIGIWWLVSEDEPFWIRVIIG